MDKSPRGGEIKRLLKGVERFFHARVEGPLKKGVREIEDLVSRELHPTEHKAQLEALYEHKLEGPLRRGLGELEDLIKKEVRLADARKHVLEYDSESPFSHIAAFLRDGRVASAPPSTKYLIRRVLKAMDIRARDCLVVEYGLGRGIMTRHVLKRMGPFARLIAVEGDAGAVKSLRRKVTDPRLWIVQGNVLDVDMILDREGAGQADAILADIPFGLLDPPAWKLLVQKTEGLLERDGRFVVYQFTTRLLPLLKRVFRRVRTEFEIRNLPPHFVFTAFK